MTARRSSKRDEKNGIDPQKYATFINQIELLGIWLDNAEIDNIQGPSMPDRVDIRITSSGSWNQIDTGFIAIHQHEVTLASGDERAAEIVVRFGLEFSSSVPMTEEIFNVFKEVNLPINTWPYLREFVSSILGRMGWLAFTLPSLKVGTRPAPEPSPDPATVKKPRRPTSTRKRSTTD